MKGNQHSDDHIINIAQKNSFVNRNHELSIIMTAAACKLSK